MTDISSSGSKGSSSGWRLAISYRPVFRIWGSTSEVIHFLNSFARGVRLLLVRL